MRINNFTPDTQIFDNINDSGKVNKKSYGNKFTDFLDQKLTEVNEKQLEAENVTENFIKGTEKDIHNVLLKTQEAKMSLEMAVEIRNKIVDAYNELNRMQL